MEIENDLVRPKKAERVREMFADIAPRYDFLNHALSLNIDRHWRKIVIRQVAGYLAAPGAVALDLCCGTGDLSLALGELAPTIGVDFCRQMLTIGLRKVRAARRPIGFVEADALQVPAGDHSFDVVTVAFGLRNLEDVKQGLAEMYRLLKPGGRAAVLEFSRPAVPIFRTVFRFYFHRVLPRIGNRISGSRFAYQYLPDSVNDFPDQQSLAGLMRSVGFSRVTYYNLSGGIAALHLGDKAQGTNKDSRP